MNAPAPGVNAGFADLLPSAPPTNNALSVAALRGVAYERQRGQLTRKALLARYALQMRRQSCDLVFLPSPVGGAGSITGTQQIINEDKNRLFFTAKFFGGNQTGFLFEPGPNTFLLNSIAATLPKLKTSLTELFIFSSFVPVSISHVQFFVAPTNPITFVVNFSNGSPLTGIMIGYENE